MNEIELTPEQLEELNRYVAQMVESGASDEEIIAMSEEYMSLIGTTGTSVEGEPENFTNGSQEPQEQQPKPSEQSGKKVNKDIPPLEPLDVRRSMEEAGFVKVKDVSSFEGVVRKKLQEIPKEDKIPKEDLEKAQKAFLANEKAKFDAAVAEQPPMQKWETDVDKELNSIIDKAFPMMIGDQGFNQKMRFELLNDPERLARYRQDKIIGNEEAFLIQSEYLRNKITNGISELENLEKPSDFEGYIAAEKKKTDFLNDYAKFTNLQTENKPIIDKIRSDQEVIDELNKGGAGNFSQDIVSRALNSLNNVATDLITLPATIASSFEDLTGRGDLYTISDRILDYADKTYKNPLLVSERQFYNEQTGEYDLGGAFLGASDQVGIITALALGNVYAGRTAIASTEGRLLTSFSKDAIVTSSKNVYTVAGGYAASLESNRRDAKEMGLSGGDAFAYTQFMSFLEGTTELIMPDNQIFSKEVKDIALKVFAANLSKGRSFAAKEALKSIGEIIGKDNLEELLVLAGKTLQTGAIALENEDVEVYVPELGEVINTVATTTVATGTIPAITNLNKRKQIENQMILKASKDPDGAKEVITQFVKKGVVKQEDAEAFLNKVDKATEAVSEIPSNFTEEESAEVLDPAIRLTELREEAKNKKGVAKEQIDEEIKALEEQIRQKAEERKAKETTTVEQYGDTQEVKTDANKVNNLFDSRVQKATETFDNAIDKAINKYGEESKRVAELRAEKDKAISDLEDKRAKKLEGTAKKPIVQSDTDVISLDDLEISDEELLALEDEIAFEEKTTQAPEVLEQGVVSDGGKNYEIISIEQKKDGSRVVKAKEVIEVTEDNINELQSDRQVPLKVGDTVKKDGSRVVKGKEVIGGIVVTKDNIENLQNNRKKPLKVGDKVYGTTKRYTGDSAEQIAKDNSLGEFKEKEQEPEPKKRKFIGRPKPPVLTVPTPTFPTKDKPDIQEDTAESIEKEVEAEIADIEKETADFVKAVEDEAVGKSKDKDLVSVKGNIYQVTRKPDGTFSVSKMRADGKLIGITRDTEERKTAISQFKRKQTMADNKNLSEAEKLIEDTRKESEDRILAALDKAIERTSFTALRGQANDVVTVLGYTAANLALKGVRAAYKTGMSLKDAIAFQYEKVKASGVTEIEFKKFVLESLKPQQNAVQEQTAGKVPVQPEAKVGEKMAEGEPQAETKVAAEEGKEKLTEAEKNKIAEKIGKVGKVTPKNIKGLLDVMGGIFGLNKKQAESAAVVGDVIIGNMAKRAGISKDEMYQKIAYQKAQKAPDGSLRQDAPLTFKSTAKEGLGKIQQTSATPEQWVKQISEKGGKGTSQELEWIGLQDYLNEWKKENNAKSVPKEVVEQYINDNQIEIVEVSKGKPAIDIEDLDAEFDGSGFVIRYSGQGNLITPYITLAQIDLTEEDTYEEDFDYYSAQEAAKVAAREEMLDREDGEVRYATYQLEGGENYREVLLTLPKKKGQDYAEKMRMKYGENLDPMQIYEKMSESERETQAKLNNESEVAYKSSHWDEVNILAHLRMNERTLPNGERVLFIEEVQSDWAQEIKKDGFYTKKQDEIDKKRTDDISKWERLKASLENERNKLKENTAFNNASDVMRRLGIYSWTGLDGIGDDTVFTYSENKPSKNEIVPFENLPKEYKDAYKVTKEEAKKYSEIKESINKIEEKYGVIVDDYGIENLKVPKELYDYGTNPDMPYKKTDQWVGMAMRRAMQMAAQEGFDRVAWVTGEQSAERYDLSKQVDKIVYEPKNGEGERYVDIYMPSGLTTFLVSSDGVIISNENTQIPQSEGKTLDEVIGKELADKILSSESNDTKTLDNEGLKVGGEGMKTFYNSILPKAAKKEAQRFDKKAKVEVVTFSENNKPEIEVNWTKSGDSWVSEDTGFTITLENNEDYVIYRGGTLVTTKDTLENAKIEAEERIDEIKGEIQAKSKTGNVGKQLSIPITPEMRMNLNGAVPLFQSAQGAMTAADGNYVVYALTNPNVSTPLHELAHVYEHYLTDTERKAIESWSGHKAGTVEFSEAFARGFEKFLAEGKISNPKLQKIFENFKEWLTEIYNGIIGSDIDIELNDTMKGIYNNMLAEDVNTEGQEKVAAKTVISETQGLTEKERNKQGFVEYTDAMKEKSAAKIKAVTESYKDKLKEAKEKSKSLKEQKDLLVGFANSLIKGLRENGVKDIPTAKVNTILNQVRKSNTQKSVDIALEELSEIAKQIEDKYSTDKAVRETTKKVRNTARAKGKSTLGQAAKAFSRINLKGITDMALLEEVAAIADELIKSAPKLTINDINEVIAKVEKAKEKTVEKKSFKDRVSNNTKKRAEAETLQQELNAELERQRLIAELSYTEEEVSQNLIEELEADTAIDFKKKTIDSFEVAKKVKGDLKKASNAIKKALDNGDIDETKAEELRKDLAEAAKKYDQEVEKIKEKEKAKYNQAKKQVNLPSDPAQKRVVQSLLDAEAVDDISWYVMANDILDSISLGTIPYKAISDLKSYSAYKSKAAKETADSIKTADTKETNTKDLVSKLGTKTASQRVRNILNIRDKAIWNNVYQPMITLTKAAQNLANNLIEPYSKAIGGIPSILNRNARKQFIKDSNKAGIVAHYIQEQFKAGLGIKADGVPVGARDIFGIWLGNEKAMDAVGMDEETKAKFKDKQALANYSKEEIKALEEIYSELVDSRLGYVDVANLDAEKVLSESQKKMYDAAREVFDNSVSYQEAANLSRGSEFVPRAMYIPTKRKGADSKSQSTPPVGGFGNLSTLASAGKDKLTESLIPSIGVFSFDLNSIVADHVADVALDYSFSTNQPAINALLTSAINQTNGNFVARAIKNDFNASLNYQAENTGDSTSKKVANALFGARYAKTLFDPIRSVVEFTSAVLTSVIKTGSINGITDVFDKKAWLTLDKIKEDFDITVAEKLDSEKTRQNIREGLDKEIFYVKLGRQVMSAPEYYSAVGLFLPTMKAEFKKLTGSDLNLDLYLNDKAYMEENKDALLKSAKVGQEMVERIQDSKVKAGTRRYLEVPFSKATIKADSVFGKVVSFFGNYVYREQGELFTSLKFIAKDFVTEGKSMDSAELRNASGVLFNAMAYSYGMSLYYIAQQLTFGDDDDKEKAIQEYEELFDIKAMATNLVGQVSFLGLSKYGKIGRLSAITSLSLAYRYTDDKEAKELIAEILKDQFYIYKPVDFSNSYSTTQLAFKESLPQLEFLLENIKEIAKTENLTEDPELATMVELAINATNLGLTSIGTQLPMTRQIKGLIKKYLKESSKVKPTKSTEDSTTPERKKYKFTNI